MFLVKYNILVTVIDTNQYMLEIIVYSHYIIIFYNRYDL